MSDNEKRCNSNNAGSGEKSFGEKVVEHAILGAVGAVAGSITLGVLGYFLGGPPGAVIGAKIGAMLGGGGGAASA